MFVIYSKCCALKGKLKHVGNTARHKNVRVHTFQSKNCQCTYLVNPHNNFFTPKLGFSQGLNIKNDLGRIEARNDLICNVVKTIQIMKCILQS